MDRPISDYWLVVEDSDDEFCWLLVLVRESQRNNSASTVNQTGCARNSF